MDKGTFAAPESTDVIIVGAGVVGCAIARELARYDIDVLVLEAGADIANGATRANSGIVHAGFDPVPGTLKARFNREGSLLFPIWADELGFRYQRNGSMVVAFSVEEKEALRALLKRGDANGIEDLRIVDAAEARRMEPNISPKAVAALVAPTGGICDPYEVALRTLENAVRNGAKVEFGARVTDIKRTPHGWAVDTTKGHILCQALVNAAGVHADEVNNIAGAPTLHITPVKGEYALYDTDFGGTFAHTMFQVPSAAGKGVLVSPTVHGNLFIGPNSHPQEDKGDCSTVREGLDEILEKSRITWPEASGKGLITNFAGLRASSASGDFVVGAVEGLSGFYNAACIDSPGLSSSPAIASYLAGTIAGYLHARLNPDFNPRNIVSKPFSDMDDAERATAIAADPLMGELVCRCCKVTEAEVVRALHGPVPALTLDAVKWHCRATMGRCHGGFCTPAVLRIMSRELGAPPETLEKRGRGEFVIASSRNDYLELAREDAWKQGRVRSSEVLMRKPEPMESEHDVVVVGGGAAGLAAARAAASQGASVLLVDREVRFGGILKQCVHSGFGVTRYGEELTGPEYARRELSDLTGVETIHGASVLELRKDAGNLRHRVVFASPKGLGYADAKAVVLATGSRERGLGALNIPGDRPAGVFTAGSAQNLMNLQGCLPGRRAVVLGSGDIGLIMARRMTLAGMEVLGVHEIADVPSGLRRNIVQCLDDFGIPLVLSSTVTRIEGRDRLSAVWASSVDPATRTPIPGTERRIECDTLVLSVGLIPENEVAKSAGVAIDPVTGGAVVDDALQTSVAGVFTCGNALHVHDLADYASREGDVAGKAAALCAQERGALGLTDGHEDCAVPVVAGEGVRYVVPQRLRTRESDTECVSLSLRVAEAVSKPRFVAEATMTDGSTRVAGTSAAMVAVPAEMARVKVRLEVLRGAASVSVRVEERE